MSEEKYIKQYMVTFNIPDPVPAELMAQIPEQRKVVNELFTSGKLASYTLTMDRTILWAVFFTSSESELIQLIDKMPLVQYADYDYYELMFHQSLRLLPTMSLN